MLSTSNNIDDIDRCYQLGCNAYVKKEVMHDKLADTLKPFTDAKISDNWQLKYCV